MVDGGDSGDGFNGYDGVDGVDGSVGHQIERTGVGDVLGHILGEWLCLLTFFAPKWNLL